MKKPSTLIAELVELRTNMDGTATLTAIDCAEIKRLTKAIDRRDQQLRKHYKPPVKKARKVGR